jgi:hypothetical protein
MQMKELTKEADRKRRGTLIPPMSDLRHVDDIVEKIEDARAKAAIKAQIEVCLSLLSPSERSGL